MGDLVNLRLHRKRAARTEREKQARENRVRSGRSKLERHAAETQADRADRDLDGHRIVPPASEGDGP